MAKAISCDCTFYGQQTPRLCLYHWGWARLIDEAREAMAGNATWTRRADEVPRTRDYPLEPSTERKLTAVKTTDETVAIPCARCEELSLRLGLETEELERLRKIRGLP
jgi:hypothetical protein